MAFTVACVLLVLTPGPNLLYLISRTLCQGRAAGIVSLAGTTTGFLVHIVAAALGLSVVFVTIPVLYDVVRWAGAAYLLYLAWDAVRPHGSGGLFARRDLPEVPRWTLYRTGIITSILNPKVALFYVALFPQFVDPSRGSVLGAVAVLGAVQIAIAVVGDLPVRARRGAGRALARRTARCWAAAQRWVLAGVFAAIAAKLALRRAAVSRRGDGPDVTTCC